MATDGNKEKARLICIQARAQELSRQQHDAERKEQAEDLNRQQGPLPPPLPLKKESGWKWVVGVIIAVIAFAGIRSLMDSSPAATRAPDPVQQPSVPEPGKDWTSPATGMEFVWIPQMGMWIGKYEVTNGEYRRKEPGHDSEDYNVHPLNGDRQPVVYVNFDDAQAYAQWLTQRDRVSGNIPSGYEYRLPTKDEFTTFVQCGDGREYPWGNEWPPPSGRAGNYSGQESEWIFKSNIYRDDFPVTCTVEQSWANSWGLYGVGGNVRECTTATPNGEFDAWRGASWSCYSQHHLRCSDRYDRDASFRFKLLGFRLVLSPLGQN